jgi:hypothetical protein
MLQHMQHILYPKRLKHTLAPDIALLDTRYSSHQAVAGVTVAGVTVAVDEEVVAKILHHQLSQL